MCKLSSRIAESAIGKVIACITTIEDLRKDDRASPKRMKRKGANRQPCLADLKIGDNAAKPKLTSI